MRRHSSFTPRSISLDNGRAKIEIRVGPAIEIASAAVGEMEFIERPAPLFTWDMSRRLRYTEPLPDGGWRVELAPDVTWDLRFIDPGHFGELRLLFAVENASDHDVYGNILPPLTGWQEEDAFYRDAIKPDVERFLYLPPYSYLNDSGPLYTWSVEETRGDSCLILSGTGREGEKFFFSAYLRQVEGRTTPIHLWGSGNDRADGSRICVPAGGEVRYILHCDGGEGCWQDGLAEIYRRRGFYRVDPARYDLSWYEKEGLKWAREVTVAWLNWAWDREVMDPRTGEYRLGESLRRAKELFGGYDVVMIWPFWPRAGVDGRDQFDHFRDMPGGIEGLREQIRQMRDVGTRTLLAYCKWSELHFDDSRESAISSYRRMIELVCELEADGMVVDISSTTPEEMFAMAKERGREIACIPEGDPSWQESQKNLIGRIHNVMPMPALNLKRFLLPHHPLLRVCEPGNAGRTFHKDFILSFLNGHGVEINTMFPERHPAAEGDWHILARAVDILRHNRDAFSSRDWMPMVETCDPKVWANRWPGRNGKVIYTLCGTSPLGHRGDLLRLMRRPGIRYVDLWRHREITPRHEEGGIDVIPYKLDPFEPGLFDGDGDYSPGCIGAFESRLDVDLDFEILTVLCQGELEGLKLEVWEEAPSPTNKRIACGAKERTEIDLAKEFGHTNRAIVVRLLDRENQLVDEAICPESFIRFFRVEKPSRVYAIGDPSATMVYIPGGSFEYKVVHTLSGGGREGIPFTCYPHEGRIVEIQPLWMDRYPVTNADFARFLKETGYRPEDGDNFLKHWGGSTTPPAELADHPVVYVSLEDARAYAEWRGARLPTEEEWQWAAGGRRQTIWPWGTEMEEGRCNLRRGQTTPINAFPNGASEFGVEDLVGNVWQWTESVMDNGAHILVYLRGGSYYSPPVDDWWVVGGPRRVNDHQPIGLMGPRMNRFATVGFRCVKDIR
ncbi:MAG: formylglycine-generating enzyme family protein [bacterium]